MRFSRSTPLIAVLGILALAACGSDDGSTGPSADFSLDGAWTLGITNAKNGNATCALSGYTVTFTTTNGTVGGTIVTSAGATASCVINGQTQTAPLGGSGSLTSASLNGSAISFGYTTSSGPSSLTGTIQSDTRMGGAATIQLSISGTSAPFVGSWSATRQ